MRKLRNIIEIDEEKCTGCGQCILDCAEGALALVDGKAKLVGEIFCDGLGACLSGCPTGALTVTQREADDFDEKAVEELLRAQGRPVPPPQGGHASHAAPAAPAAPAMACGCPGSAAMALKPAASTACAGTAASTQASTLGHWPIKLALLSPQAPFIKNADLVLLADCAAAALPDLHARVLPGKAIALACPKLDDAQAHIKKLAAVLAEAQPRSLSVVHMEVPCCHGLMFVAQKAVEMAGVNTPIKAIVVGRDGKVQEDPGMLRMAAS
jgi:ferredoxin